MGTLTPFLSEDTVRQVGWVLVHFLWQGCAIAGLLWTVLKIAGKASSNSRYMIACTGLALMVLAPAVTFFVIMPDKPLTAVQPAEPAPAMAATDAAPVQTHVIGLSQEPAALPKAGLLDTVKARLEAALPGCVAGWLCGVAALSLWYLGGWCQLQRLRRIGTKSVPDTIAGKTAALAQQLGIRKAVYIVESALVQVPTVIGWIKPVILLPATALTGLDEIQLRAMIAHELAHIKRYDYLVNIAQTVVEILGFYHPAVWWTSRQIRIERENCCDDVAIGLVQNRKEYAQALFSMEAIRAKQHTLAVAATGGAPLTNRIQRIAGKETNNPTSGWIPSVAAALILLILIVSVSLAAKQDTPNDPAAAMMDKQKVAAFFKDFEQALQNGDRQAVEQSLYFENDAIRQKAQPYITDLLDDNITLLTSFRIIRVDQSADNSLSVFGLYPVQGKMYVTNTLPVKIENGRYQLDLFNAEFFKKIEDAKTQPPQQIGRNSMQEQLDKWQTADSDELNRLIQTLIKGEQNNLAAVHYAKDNDLQMMPHLTIPEITRRLARYKTTNPEQLRRDLIEELTAQLQDNNETKPSSSKAAPVTSDQNGLAEKTSAHLESMNHLRQLGLAHFIFRDDNEGDVPDNLETLKPYLDEETYRWIADNAVLLDIKKDLTEAETAATPVAYDKTFLEKTGHRIVVFADGHVEIDTNDGLEEILNKAIVVSRVERAKKLNDIGFALTMWLNNHDDIFPDSIGQIAFKDKMLKEWAIENIEYLAAGKVFSDLEEPAKEVIAYDRELSHTDNSTNLLFADGHVEFVEQGKLGNLVPAAGTRFDAAPTEQELMTASDPVSAEKIAQAKSFYEQANNIFYAHTTADASIKKTKMTEALALYRQAAETAPSDSLLAAWSMTMAGLCCNHLTDHKASIEAFHQSIDIYPNSAGTYFYLGNAYQQLDQKEEAIEAYKNCITLCNNRGENAFPYSKARYALMKLGLNPWQINALEKTETPDQTQHTLTILNTELEPVAQGKNVLYATVKNTTDTEQLFAIHIQTRSVDYGPDGVGWGTPFFETLKPGETKRLRFVYKIQGPVTDNTYIRVKYFNPATEDDYGETEPFAVHLYEGGDLPTRPVPQTVHPATKAQFEEISEALKIIQNHIRNKEYENAWGLFTEDYQKAEYQIRGFEWFQRQMEPTHPTHSAFLWEKEDFLKLRPLKAFTDNGTLKLQAACDNAQWTIDFVEDNNTWKINWIAGYSPAVVAPPSQTENDKLLLGPNGTGYFDRDAAIQIGDGRIKVGRRIEVENTGSGIIEITSMKNQSKVMPGRMGGFGGLRQEDKINFSDKSEIDQLLQEQLNTSIDLSPLKGGVLLSEAIEYIRSSVDPPLPIVVDWDELKEKGGILPTDKARPGGYTKAPIHDALRETLYYVSKDKSLQIRDIIHKETYKDIPLSVEFVIENNQIFIKYNPYNLARKTYTLRPELNYDPIGSPSKADDLRDWIIKEIWPLIDTEQKQRKGRPVYPEISLEDGGILNVTTTEEAHKEIAEKLDKLEPFDLKQIAIEARFILIDNNNFLKDIGIDRPDHIVGQVIEGPANSAEIKTALEPKPLNERILPFDNYNVLDDLQVNFLIKATQQHKNAKVLTAPKVVVLNGESATLQVYSAVRYMDTGVSYTDIDSPEKYVDKGVKLDILPIIQQDNNEILLKGHAVISDILESQTQSHTGKEYDIPYMQVTEIPIHTIIESRGTLLIIGPELTRSQTFGRSIIRDKQRLLILVKPTIIEQEQQQDQ